MVLDHDMGRDRSALQPSGPLAAVNDADGDTTQNNSTRIARLRSHSVSSRSSLSPTLRIQSRSFAVSEKSSSNNLHEPDPKNGNRVPQLESYVVQPAPPVAPPQFQTSGAQNAEPIRLGHPRPVEMLRSLPQDDVYAGRGLRGLAAPVTPPYHAPPNRSTYYQRPSCDASSIVQQRVLRNDESGQAQGAGAEHPSTELTELTRPRESERRSDDDQGDSRKGSGAEGIGRVNI